MYFIKHGELRNQSPSVETIQMEIRMEVSSSRPDHLPTLLAAKTSKLSLILKHHILAIDEAR